MDSIIDTIMDNILDNMAAVGQFGRMKKPDAHDVEIAVVGAGPGGLAAALALAAAGFDVTVLDRASGAENPGKQKAPTTPDPRATALSPSSLAMLTRLDVIRRMNPAPHPVAAMEIADGHPDIGFLADNLSLHNARDVANDVKAVAHIVMNEPLKQALTEAAQAHPHIRLAAPVDVTGVDKSDKTAGLRLETSAGIMRCHLLVACDGRQSPLRHAMKIRSLDHAYGQRALVTTFRHTRPHDDIARQFFRPAGPLACLPLAGNTSALVWVEAADYAQALASAPLSHITAELAHRLDGVLGEIELTAPPIHYPLSLMLAESYTAPHFALMGEAAHVIHPLAGQGYNLTLRDAACLAETLYRARHLGLDIGSLPALQPYARQRRADAYAMAATTHGLNKLFSRPSGIASLVRQIGIGLAGRRLGLTGQAVRQADTGLAASGNLPRLLRGEAFNDG